ncbi:MAG: carotenoid oxygenase family protein [Acidimicrobiales bacterium]
MTAVENKWLEGPYAPIEGDVTATELIVEGTLPVELEGRYLRNGPNPITPVDPATHHWFVGDAMVHGIRLRDGKADWYHARMVRSTAVSEALGEAPAPGERHGGMETANTNVIGVGGKTLAIVEAGGRPVELSYELDTICHSDLDGTLPHGYTAHPKVDPATGDRHAIAYHWALPHLEYIVMGSDGRVKQVSPVEVADGPMVHDCSITERWTVVYDLPVTFDLDAAMVGGSFPYTWKADRPARLGLIPLGGSGADVRWFEVAPCYVFHPLNAHDDGDKVVLDVVRYDRMFDAKRLGPDDSAPLLWRWTIDTGAGTVTEEPLGDQAMEFPRVDERVVGRPHRWGYASAIRRADQDNGFGGDLVRIDGKSGDMTRIDLGAGRIGGEWVMVPRHEAAAEDDGWLMTLVYDARTDRSELVVLPAADPADGPVARVMLPNRVPLGFHGNWVPDVG